MALLVFDNVLGNTRKCAHEFNTAALRDCSTEERRVIQYVNVPGLAVGERGFEPPRLPLPVPPILTFDCLCACFSSFLPKLPVSTLPEAAHIDLTTLRSRTHTSFRGWGWMTRGVVKEPSSLGWQELLIHLRHIKKTNPRRLVRRLTFDSTQKLGSLSSLSSATDGLLTHIDFSRTYRKVDFDQLAANLPGLRGLGVRGDTLTRRKNMYIHGRKLCACWSHVNV